MSSHGWIGVDLDGTLAKKLPNYDPHKVGPAVPKMAKRVRRALRSNHEVRIFTARKGSKDFDRQAIDRFSVHNFRRRLPITDKKDERMEELWDDRAVGVKHNTGEINVMPQAMGIGNLAAALRERMQGKRGISGKFKFKHGYKRRHGRVGVPSAIRRRRMKSEESSEEESEY